jgi:hypothetical protein
MPQHPSDAGQAMAEALIAQLELLKRSVAGPEATAAQQLVAGEAAVAALKQVLGGVVSDMLPPTSKP